jgi:hypothetical protein
MTTISSTFNPSATHGRAHQHENQSLSRGIAIAAAVVSIVLAATLLETRGTSPIQTGDGWQGIEQQISGGWQDSVPLDLIPLGVLPPDTSR